jgi:hypothetical protein
MKTHQNLFGFVLILFILFTAHFTLTASETYRSKGDTLRYLKLTHLKTGDTILLKTGEFIKVVYEKKAFKGTIDSIEENSFYMRGKEFELEKLNLIFVNHRYSKLRTIFVISFWIDMALAYVTLFLLLIYMFYLLAPDENESLASLETPLLIILLAAPFLAAATIVLNLKSRLYKKDLMKYWKIESLIR